MAKINFNTKEDLNNCNPELVSKVRKVTSLDELKTLTDEYDMNQVEDAMFAIMAEDGNSASDLEEAITDLLWDEYNEQIYEGICDSFLNRNNKERRPMPKEGVEQENMRKISFTTEKEIDNCNPELVNKMRNVSTREDLDNLIDEYDRNEVEDAMFAIVAEEGTGADTVWEEAITDLLWDEYYDHIYEDVCSAFLNRKIEHGDNSK